eukprot:2532512-Amphidinium_carterae.1
MARARHVGRLLSGVALLALSTLCSCWSRTSAPEHVAFAVGLSPSSLLGLIIYQIPGLFMAAAGALLAGFTVRSVSGRFKYPAAIALGVLAIVFAQLLISSSPLPGGGVATKQAAGEASGIPKSGEETWKGGSFKRIHDPRSEDGKVVDEEWKRLLWQDMNNAVKAGSDQVVVMFSTRGCKYCDKQLAAFRKAIKTRELAKQDAKTAIFGDTLRVFVYDMEEFGPTARGAKDAQRLSG